MHILIFLYKNATRTTVMKKTSRLSKKNAEETLSGAEKTLRDPEAGTEGTERP